MLFQWTLTKKWKWPKSVGVYLSIKANSLTGRNISLFTVFDLSTPLILFYHVAETLYECCNGSSNPSLSLSLFTNNFLRKQVPSGQFYFDQVKQDFFYVSNVPFWAWLHNRLGRGGHVCSLTFFTDKIVYCVLLAKYWHYQVEIYTACCQSLSTATRKSVFELHNRHQNGG